MKQLVVINVHSFVDLITNSSSELFVCDDKKSVEAVRELLLKLAEVNNELDEHKAPTNDDLFVSVFKEPTISKYEFSYWKFPSELRKEYEKYHNMHSTFEHSWWGGDERNYENSPRYKELEAKEREFEKKFEAEHGDGENLSEEARSAWWRKRHDASSEIWREWADDSARATVNLFAWFLENNGFSKKEVEKVRTTYDHKSTGRYAWITFKGKKINDAFSLFSQYLSYGIDTQKGSILIESASDNTIPWKLMESVCTYLNARRWHIG